MNTLRDQLVDVCDQLHYKVTEVDDSSVSIRYQMHNIHICYNEKSPNDCTVMTAVMKEIPEGERMQVLERCNDLNERLKHYKYYIMGPVVVASIEFCFGNNDELKYQMDHAVRYVSTAKSLFERIN